MVNGDGRVVGFQRIAKTSCAKTICQLVLILDYVSAGPVPLSNYKSTLTLTLCVFETSRVSVSAEQKCVTVAFLDGNDLG